MSMLQWAHFVLNSTSRQLIPACSSQRSGFAQTLAGVGLSRPQGGGENALLNRRSRSKPLEQPLEFRNGEGESTTVRSPALSVPSKLARSLSGNGG